MALLAEHRTIATGDRCAHNLARTQFGNSNGLHDAPFLGRGNASAWRAPHWYSEFIEYSKLKRPMRSPQAFPAQAAYYTENGARTEMKTHLDGFRAFAWRRMSILAEAPKIRFSRLSRGEEVTRRSNRL